MLLRQMFGHGWRESETKTHLMHFNAALQPIDCETLCFAKGQHAHNVNKYIDPSGKDVGSASVAASMQGFACCICPSDLFPRTRVRELLERMLMGETTVLLQKPIVIEFSLFAPRDHGWLSVYQCIQFKPCVSSL